MDDKSVQATIVRKTALNFLETAGFRPASWLPLPDIERELRPVSEIASRLLALGGLFSWASSPEEAMPTVRLQRILHDRSVRQLLTDDEIGIVKLSRADARESYAESIGWKLENMWPLAWVLGFDVEPTIEASQIDMTNGRAILFDFLGGLEITVAQIVQRSRFRPAAAVIELEDRFYCAHNAVRSAQQGGDNVPPSFHPIAHGGVVHERRHALTWCLSPGVAWDEVDLST